MSAERKPMRYAHSDGHTDVCYSQNGEKLITCGTDGDIRIWSGFDDDDPTQTCVGEWSLCVQHNKDHLYVATDSYRVQSLTYPEGERDGIIRKFTAPVNHMAVSKDKKYIAVASENMQVKLINLSDTKDETTFEGLKGPPLSIALCPNSKHLAVSSGDTFLRIYSLEDQRIVHQISCVQKTNSFMNATALCRMDFDPKLGQYLAYPEKDCVTVLNTDDWAKKTSYSCSSVDSSYSIVRYSPCGNYIAGVTLKGELVIWDVTTASVIEHSTHPKSVAICALAWNPSGNGELAYCDVEGQLGVVINCSSAVSNVARNDFIQDECFEDADDDKLSLASFKIDDDDEDNENAVSLEKLKKEIMGGGSDDEVNEIPSRRSTPRPRTPEIPLQEPFMPSSTPTHLDPRYMCWNDVAVVRCYGSSLDDDVETGKHIEVEFHDYSFHNSMMMQNYHGYFMGTISTSALVVASSSQITVVPLSASTKEWNLTVEDADEIVSIACSKNLICFGTSNYFVRVCSIYGIQKSMFSVPGPIVSMAAFNNLLLIAYHSGSVRKSDQCIQIILAQLEGFSVACRELSIALRPESHLQWIGFSDIGTPVIMDSTGILSIYPLKSNAWIPMCDTTKLSKSPADGFFVVAVYESLQTVRGVICKGSMYPTITPRPTQGEHPLQPLFLEPETEKVLLEANLFSGSVLQVENSDKKFKETGLKAFALACKNNMEERALELIEMFENQQLLSLAIKYATRLDKRRLAEKLSILSAKDDEEVPVATPPVKTVSRKLVLSSSKISANKRKHVNAERTAPTTPVASTSTTNTPSTNTPSTNMSSTNTSSTNTPLSNSTTLNRTEQNLSINTQESLFSEESPRNPFAIKKREVKENAHNPISLKDKYAGITLKDSKNQDEQSDKRKRNDALNGTDEPKEKQRKLDAFMFSKK